MTTWQGFTFVGGSKAHSNSDLPIQFAKVRDSSQVNRDSAFLLSQAQVGDRVRVVDFARNSWRHDFKATGLHHGTELEVINTNVSGSVIIAVGDRQMGVGADLSRQIQVEHCAPRSAS